MRRTLLILSTLGSIAIFSPQSVFCADFSYYLQAVTGHVKILWSRTSIQKLLQDPKTPPVLQERLRLVLQIRDFASRELLLPENDSYRTYADLKRSEVVYNVVAAPEFSLQPMTWSFPFAGTVSYRGYYDKQDAERFAADLHRKGYDTDVYGVSAYSTLGWFNDPVLNTFLDRSETALAGLIFHELAHQQLYVKDDSSFSEAFAEVVEGEGVKRWLEHNGLKSPASSRNGEGRQQVFINLLLQTRHELEALYSSEKASAEMRTAKSAILADLHRRYRLLREGEWADFKGFDHWFDRPVNNARLAGVATYHDRKPPFLELLRRDHGDLRRFYEDAAVLARLPRAQRDKKLAELAGQ